MDTIILAGGKGTRLQSVVSDVPKPMAPIAGKPFLDILLEFIASQEVTGKVILSVGYMHDVILRHYEEHTLPFDILFSVEDEPLGTGGAFVKALGRTTSSEVLVCNGDSIIVTELDQAMGMHEGIGTIITREIDDAYRSGFIEQDETGRILAFEEKGRSGRGLINAGMYMFDKEVADFLPDGAFSLEQEGFPLLIPHGLFSYQSNGFFIDIGTESSYHDAQLLLAEMTQ